MQDGNSPTPNGSDDTGDSGIFRLSDGEGRNGGNENFVDPATATSPGNGSVGGSSTGRRGRPKGSKNRTAKQKKETVSLDTASALASAVFAIHTGLAIIAKTPELELDENEADKITKAGLGVARHYANVQMTEKAADWVALFSALGAVYGPRWMAIKIRRQNTRPPQTTQAPQAQAQKPQPAPPSVAGQVVVFPGQGPNPSLGSDYGGGGAAPPVG